MKELRLETDESVQVTTSVGAVFYSPCAGEEAASERLIEEVDGAMYEAKRRGGDQFAMIRFDQQQRLPAVSSDAN